MSISLEEAFASLPITLKDHQKEIFQSLMGGENVFAVLPTGYGKSICFGYFGHLMDKVHPGAQHIVLVISPLKALMTDQVRRWTDLSIRCAAVTREMSQEDMQSVLDCNVNLVFMSPEAISQKKWRDWIRQQKNKICLFALDEVHCMTSWGRSFRMEYLNVPSLRAEIMSPVLLLTATVTQDMVTDILKLLRLETCSPAVKMITYLPDRPNIFLEVKSTSKSNITKEAVWIIPHLRQGKTAGKMIIYCRTVGDVQRVYGQVMKQLGNHAWISDEHTVFTRIIQMYHSHVAESCQRRILSSFFKQDTHVRCVVATVAFGLGVQVPDVRHVVHWGPAADILSYWQEVGRCARDDCVGNAIMYLYPKSVNKSFIDGQMIEMLDKINKGNCIRKCVFEYLHVTGMSTDFSQCCEHQGCCSVCNTQQS